MAVYPRGRQLCADGRAVSFGMTETDNDKRGSRMETLAPGVPVAAKLALLLGLAGGLFVTIILSYAAPAWQYFGLGIGIGLGLIGAGFLAVRAKR